MNHLKRKKFVVSCICMGLFVLITMGFIGRPFAGGYSDGEIVIKTFNCSGAQFQSLTVRGWEMIQPEDYSKDPVGLLKRLAVSLFRPGSMSMISTTDNGIRSFQIKGHASEDITASLSLAIHAESLIENKGAYLILSLESSNPASLRLMNQLYRKIMSNETNKSIVINGHINRKLSPLETNTVVEKMVKKANAKNVESIAERGMVSISGYSPNVRNVLTLDGKWVNINMALRYNSLAKRTMVYVGSPVISIEY